MLNVNIFDARRRNSISDPDDIHNESSSDGFVSKTIQEVLMTTSEISSIEAQMDYENFDKGFIQNHPKVARAKPVEFPDTQLWLRSSCICTPSEVCRQTGLANSMVYVSRPRIH